MRSKTVAKKRIILLTGRICYQPKQMTLEFVQCEPVPKKEIYDSLAADGSAAATTARGF